jgi:hypothetical protein
MHLTSFFKNTEHIDIFKFLSLLMYINMLVKAAVGGKLHRRGGRPTSHMSCKQTCRPEKVGAVSPPTVWLERGKLVAEAPAQENSE